MDIGNAMDQYEKQLYSLFESFDSTHTGRLNREALVDLCESLQLEDRGQELVNLLMGDTDEINVAFPQFRDGLLTVLGGEESRGKSVNILERNDIHSGEDSSGREVSPKYTFGSKKYGRRSRPVQSNLLSPDTLYSEPIPETDSSSLEIQISDTADQTPVAKEKVITGKKRRTSNKLRRSISFSGTKKESEIRNKSLDCTPLKYDIEHDNTTEVRPFHTKANIDTTCESGFDPTLNDHLKFVDCNSNSQCNSNKYVCNYDSALKNDIPSEETSGSNGRLIQSNDIKTMSSNLTVIQSHCDISEDLVSLGTIMELWESAGVYQPIQLLSDLGFKGENAKLSQVISVLEDEIRLMGSNLQEVSTSSQLTTLLQAVMCLHKCEIRNLKSSVIQTSAERDKLRADLYEANLRATLLAQEVDDNHNKMETAARNNIKLLEQKHSEIVKHLTNQILSDKEQSAAVLSSLEQKTSILEVEESKLKLQLSMANDENIKLEKEVNNLQEQISELIEIKRQLSKDIKSLSNEKQQVNYNQCTLEKNDSLFFETQIEKLQKENIFLKDRNDELCAELESLHVKTPNQVDKISTSEQSSQVDISSVQIEGEPMGTTFADVSGVNGVKRRGDSPSKSVNDFLCEEESPRICKLRKYHKKKSSALEKDDHQNIITQDCNSIISQNNEKFSKENSGSDTNSEIDEGHSEKLDLFITKQIEPDDIQHIKQLVKETTTLSVYFCQSNIKTYYLCTYWLIKNIIHDIILYANHNCNFKELTDSDIKLELQKLITDMTSVNLDSYVDSFLHKSNEFDSQDFHACCLSQGDIIIGVDTNSKITHDIEYVSQLKNKIEELSFLLEKEKQHHQEDKSKDLEKCNELEASVELLKNEFDKCEEYWASKLDEEREIFDQEQRMSDEKFTELVSKVAEYEEQFASHDIKNNDRCDGPLSTIEEKYNLEKQFTDLEDEFEEYKLKSESELNMKSKEINLLTEQIKHFEQTRINTIDSEHIHEADYNDSTKCKDEEIFLQLPKISDIDTNPDAILIISQESKSTQTELLTKENEPKPYVPEENRDTSSNIGSPIDYLWNQSAIPSPLTNVQNAVDTARDYQNPAFLKDNITENGCRFLMELPNINNVKNITPIQKPISPKTNFDAGQDESLHLDKLSELRPEGKMLHCSELEEALQGRRKEVLQLEATRARLDAEVRALSVQRVPQQTIASAGLKTAVLEVRCRQLQTALRQQHSYTEALMQQTVTAHRGEVGALRQRLAAADLLVRDLYVENCHLARSLSAPSQH